MMRFLLPMMGAALVMSGPGMAEASIGGDEPAPVDGTFRIGSTGIHCVREPCPWRGITRIGEDGHREGWPLWSGSESPVVKADDDTQRRIDASWRDHGCLIVQGRFEKGELAVHRVISEC